MQTKTSAVKTMATAPNIAIMKGEVTDVVVKLDTHLTETARNAKVS